MRDATLASIVTVSVIPAAIPSAAERLVAAPFRIGLAGFGLAGQAFHGPLISATPGLGLVAVVSSDAAKVHAHYPHVAVAADFAALLAAPMLDAVVLATPDHLHAEQAVAALGAGKHVVIDKPLAPTLAEAQRIAAVARDSERLVTVFHNRRWDADFLTLRQLIASGALGEVVQCNSHFDRFRPDLGTRWKDRREGGVWQDLGPHLIDQALELFGMPLAVYADIGAQKPGGTAPDYAHVLLRYDRLRVILHISQSAPDHGLRFAVHGTCASWIKRGIDPQEEQAKAGLFPGAPGWGIDPQPGLLTQTDGATSEVPNLTGDYPAFYAALRDAWAGTGPNPVPLDQGIAVMAVLEAGFESARTQREVAPWAAAPVRSSTSLSNPAATAARVRS